MSKDYENITETLKNIDNKLTILESKIDQIFEILNTFSLLMYEEDEDENKEDNEDWTPYDDDNWEIDSDDDNQTYTEDFSDN